MILRNQQDPRYRIKKNRPVYVYKNLHKDCWSIKQHGLVKAHVPRSESVAMWDCYFHVDIKGREKVLREKRKNVHAFVCGEWDQKEYRSFKDMMLWRKVSYNPKRDDFFMVQQFSDPTKYKELDRNMTYAVALETENGKPITRI